MGRPPVLWTPLQPHGAVKKTYLGGRVPRVMVRVVGPHRKRVLNGKAVLIHASTVLADRTPPGRAGSNIDRPRTGGHQTWPGKRRNISRIRIALPCDRKLYKHTLKPWPEINADYGLPQDLPEVTMGFLPHGSTGLQAPGNGRARNR